MASAKKASEGAQRQTRTGILDDQGLTHGRDKKVAMRMLEESLRRLRTDHLDLWQVHEVIYENDPDLIFARTAPRKLCSTPRNKAKFDSSDSLDTKILRSI